MLTNRLKRFSLFLGDVALLYAALYITLILRYTGFPVESRIWAQHLMPFTVLFAFWALVFYINGLYEISHSKNDVEFYNRVFRNLLINFALAAGYFYLLTDRLFSIKPQAVFFIFVGVSLVLISMWRYWYNNFVSRPSSLKNVLIIGMKDEARELIEEIIRKPQFGYRIAAIIMGGNKYSGSFPGAAIYEDTADIKQILRDKQISTVVTAFNPHSRSNSRLIEDLYESLALHIQFYDLPTFYEKLTGKIPITSIGHIWFLQNLTESEKNSYETFKRFYEVVFSILGLVISIPLVPFIIAAVKLTSKGPLFFRQVRVGHMGKRFTAIKFRTMIENAEVHGEAQWAQKNDPRVTKIGGFLRRTRLDEIPQLVNILRGEMSLIGPRPERPEFVENLNRDIPFYNDRHLCKPGLTGWAQISFQYGASTRDAFKKLQYDLFYVKNRSLPLDVAIMLKTINIMLSGKGR